MPILPEKNKLNVLLEGPSDPGIDYLISQRQLSHKMEKEFRQVRRFFASPSMMKNARSPYKDYPGKTEFPIGLDLMDTLKSFRLDEVFRSRQTGRYFGKAPLTRSDLEFLMLMAAGERRHQGLPLSDEGTAKRFVLSGGGLYPTEVYYMNLRHTEIPKGLYHFHPGKNCLQLIRDDVLPVESLYRDAKLTDQSSLASGVLFVTSLVERNRIKYGARAPRFIYLDAGHISQNLALGSSAMGIAYWPQGAVNEENLCPYLGIDGLYEAVIHTGVFASLKFGKTKVSFMDKVKSLFWHRESFKQRSSK